MRSMLQCDMRRTLLSWRFALAVLGIPLVRFAGSTQMFTGDVLSTMIYSNDLYEVAVALAAVPFVADFAQALNGKSYLPYVLRCGQYEYVRSKLITLILTAFLCNMLGQMLYIGILALGEPLLSEASQIDYIAYSDYFLGQALLNWNPYPFMLGQILCSGIVCVEFAVMSLFVSVLCTSVLFVYALPFLLYMGVSYLTWVMGIPYYLVPSSQYAGWMTHAPWRDTLILLGQAIGMVALFGGLFLQLGRRRMLRA